MRTLGAYLPAVVFVVASAGLAFGWHVRTERKQAYCSHPSRITHYQECLHSARPSDAATAAGDQYNGFLLVAIAGMSVLTLGIALAAVLSPGSRTA